MKALGLIAALLATPAFAAAAPGPEQVVKDTAAAMFDALDAHAAAIKADPAKVEPLVAKILLPNFEVDYAARLVLGANWRTATPEQQQRFQAAFVHFLTRTYGKAIVSFKRDQLSFLPLRGAVDPKRTTVQTEVKRASGAPIPVDYVLRETPQGWKVFDVVIEGISYVRNYRTSFGDEIEREGKGDPRQGLDALIARLESADPDADAKPQAAKP